VPTQATGLPPAGQRPRFAAALPNDGATPTRRRLRWGVAGGHRAQGDMKVLIDGLIRRGINLNEGHGSRVPNPC
jgi:hypothetical protein